MPTQEKKERKDRIKGSIERLAYVDAQKTPYVRFGEVREAGWIFDIKNMLMHAPLLKDAAALFWDTFGNAATQIGTIESAGIPLAAGIVAHAGTFGSQQAASGFYMRKSRKKEGLTKIIEGEIAPHKRIVLVDDVINTGSSFMRQVEVVESLGFRVHAIWAFIRYRDPSYYTYFKEKGIAIHSLFELNDFTETLGTKNLVADVPPPRQTFNILWKFVSQNPGYHHVVPKSDPALDNERVFFGSDAGTFWALNQNDGSVAWSRKVGFHPKGKGIFSSPALHDGLVYFGAYDGNVYALDAKTGKTKWIYMEADWVGPSPALAPDLGLLFIGLEFGLWRKRGGIVALDLKTGKKKWGFFEMPCLTHSSPLYIQKSQQVVIGNNDGAAYLFDAKSGKLIWKYETGKLTEKELDTGFSSFDIKESFACDEKRNLVIFGNMNGDISFVDRKSGKQRGSFKAEFGIFSTPVIHKDSVLCSSLDKHLYCISLDTFKEKWRWNAGARIFATPVIIEGSVYVGSNAGRLTELDPRTGAMKSSFTVTERIVNRVAYNPATKRFFLPTHANELYCLEKKQDHPKASA